MKLTVSPLELLVALGLANHTILEDEHGLGSTVRIHSSGSGGAGAGTDHPMDHHTIKELNDDLDTAPGTHM